MARGRGGGVAGSPGIDGAVAIPSAGGLQDPVKTSSSASVILWVSNVTHRAHPAPGFNVLSRWVLSEACSLVVGPAIHGPVELHAVLCCQVGALAAAMPGRPTCASDQPENPYDT